MIEVKIVAKKQKRSQKTQREREHCVLCVYKAMFHTKSMGHTKDVLWNYTNEVQTSGHRAQPHSGHLQPWRTPLRYADWSSTAPASSFQQKQVTFTKKSDHWPGGKPRSTSIRVWLAKTPCIYNIRSISLIYQYPLRLFFISKSVLVLAASIIEANGFHDEVHLDLHMLPKP